MRVLELFFGRWQDKPIDKVVNFDRPGLYFLQAKTFGLKGLVGGTHSWIVHVHEDLRNTVIEVTDVETLLIQGAKQIVGFKESLNPDELQVLVSDRDGGQLWFGAEPRVLYLGQVGYESVLEWVTHYPLLKRAFNVFLANCNTFTSWIMHILGADVWTGIGAKTSQKWKTLK